jgi:hypothetical protein
MLARLRELVPDLEADGYAYAPPAIRGGAPTRLAYTVLSPTEDTEVVPELRTVRDTCSRVTGSVLIQNTFAEWPR